MVLSEVDRARGWTPGSRVQSASIDLALSGQLSAISLNPTRAESWRLIAESNLPGAVAQLGERLICIQEVAGSIPTSSTSFEEGPLAYARGSVPSRSGL